MNVLASQLVNVLKSEWDFFRIDLHSQSKTLMEHLSILCLKCHLLDIQFWFIEPLYMNNTTFEVMVLYWISAWL